MTSDTAPQKSVAVFVPALAIVLLSSLPYIIPRLIPALDPVWSSSANHFYIVVLTSLVSLLTASFLLVVVDRTDTTAFFLTLSFLTMASLFTVHGISTPGILIPGLNIAVGWTARLSLTTGAFFFVIALADFTPTQADWLAQRANIIALITGILMALLVVVVLLELPFVVAITNFGPSGTILAAVTIGLLLFSIYRTVNHYRRTGDRLYFVLAVVFGWLILAQISQYEAPIWAFSWWMYHIYMLLAYTLTMAFLVQRYEQKQDFRITRYFASLSVLLGVPITFLLAELAVRLSERPDLRYQLVAFFGIGIFLMVLALFVLVVRAGQVLERRRQLIEQEKNWRRDMTSLIAHDLSSPLNAILLDLDMLERTLPPADEKALERVKRVQQSGRAMSELIFEMLNIEKMEARALQLQRQPVDMTELVQESLSQIKTSADYRDIDIRIDVSETPIMANLDTSIISRVVQNLLSNAIKFSPQGGTVHMRLWEDADTVRLFVADKGPGIPAAQREHIFDKFGQARREDSQAGFGLGLAFCKLAVEEHNGRIWVEENTPNGSVFHVSLPI